MAEVTYYFNAYVTPVWIDPDNLVDGDTGTFAASGAGKKGRGSTEQALTGNTCPGDDLGTITEVKIRVYAYGDGNDRIDITPVFTGGDGDTHEAVPVVSPGAWTGYVDITSDTNAPDWSLWSHIQTLDCIINNVAVSKANIMYASKVEIRVTYLPPLPSYDFDIGSPAIDRPTSTAYGRTLVDKNNPANASGILHTIEIYVASVSMTGLRVGTFYTTNGNTLKCRDSAVIGDATKGLNRLTELSLTVVAGDYIGCYFTTGFIEETGSGYDGCWRVDGEYIDPNDEAEYTFQAGWAISIFGYGDIVGVVAPTVTTQAVTDIGSTAATGNGNITNTGGEDCSKRGICWNTIGSPTVADSKSEETDSFGTGAFTRPMTGLTPEEHYYVKAYAYNSEGYGYGGEVEFDTTWQPPVSDIDVGAYPVNRDNLATGLYTRIDKNNPANASGTLHTVKVWAAASMTGLRVGTFYTTDGDTLKCRDSVLIGDVVHGAERTFTGLSIAVETGDYLGSYFDTGSIERSTTGYDGIWDIAGEYIDPNDEAVYTPRVGDAISLYGYGDFAPPGLENKSANMASKLVAAGLI